MNKTHNIFRYYNLSGTNSVAVQLSLDCINGKYLWALPTPTTFEKVDQTFIIDWQINLLNHNSPQLLKNNRLFGDNSQKGGTKCRLNNYDIKNYLLIPKRFLNLSTRPPVSTNFCFPVKNGWHFEQTSTRMSFFVEPVSITLPQAHVIVVC